MKTKTLIYLFLTLGLFIFFNYVILQQKENRHVDEEKRLIKILEAVDHDHKFSLVFTVLDESASDRKATVYKIFDKTEENAYKLKSKPNHRLATSDNVLLLSPIEDYQLVYDNINTVSIEVITNLLKNFDDFILENHSFSGLSKHKNIIPDNPTTFSRLFFGTDVGADSLLRSIIVLFILMICFEYFINWINHKTKRNFRLILHAVGLVIGFRVVTAIEFGGLSVSALVLPITIFLFEILLALIPISIFRLVITKWKLKFDFLDNELIKAILIFIIGIAFILGVYLLMVWLIVPAIVGDAVSHEIYNYNGGTIRPMGIIPLLSLAFANAFHNVYKKLLIDWKENKSNAANKAMVLESEAKLEEIQSSVNPHFLYNSFNSVAALAKKDPEKTEEMTLALSAFYKYTTNREGKAYSNIKEEVDMIKNYLRIEKVRFGDKLNYTMDVSGKLLREEIPYFILQPLVENAIKYGYDKQTDSIKIRIDIQPINNDIKIGIYDNGSDFDEELSKGYGLRSVTKKLQLLYPNAHEISFNNDPKHVAITLKNVIND